MSALGGLIADGRAGGRLWLYANYHCNLACTYCLTGSSPTAPRRVLDPARMLRLADEAVALGFTGIGISGGEPLLNPWLPRVVVELSERLPVILLTNGTLFTPRRLREVAAFAGRPIEVQISLDSADPIENDAMRGPANFARVVEAVPLLVALGITVRIATTIDRDAPNDLPRLCALHRALGVDDAHHIVRPVITRGRAAAGGLGVPAGRVELWPELTVTADGAFWSPFGATSRDGRELDAELLLTPQVEPLHVPADALAAAVSARPAGDDAYLGIR